MSPFNEEWRNQKREISQRKVKSHGQMLQKPDDLVEHLWYLEVQVILETLVHWWLWNSN